jgi:hypothetical protein
MRELLEQSKRQHIPYELAFQKALGQVRPKERGWNERHWADESPLDFLERVMGDAYEGKGPKLFRYVDLDVVLMNAA